MGFFSDLKEDLSQAVNELIPEEENKIIEPEQDETGVSLDEMLENIDAIQFPEMEERASVTQEEVHEESQEEGPKVQEESLEETEALPELADMDIESMLEGVVATQESIEKKESDENKGARFTMDNYAGKEAVDETAVITAGMTITGDMISEGSVDIIGCINGNINICGKLNVTGHINGNSKAAEIFAEGAKINGQVVSDGAVKIGASSVIIGDITASSAAIAGAVKGDIDVRGPVILDASAIVMGNIKSKSVQINNGAVVEGMCSQCYAEVSPTSFFDEYKTEEKKPKNK